MVSRTSDMTKDVAEDFILFKRGKGSPINSISLSAKTLRRIAKDVEQNHGELFANMLRAIDCSSDEFSESFKLIVENMFADNVINWGRIAVLFTFSGHLAAYCDKHNMQEEADLVATWLTAFANRRLLKWIQNCGGWESFNEHFKERKDDGVGWSEVLCTVGLVASVAGAAGAALVLAR